MAISRKMVSKKVHAAISKGILGNLKKARDFINECKEKATKLGPESDSCNVRIAPFGLLRVLF